MDLPISNKNRAAHSSHESLSSSDDIGDRTPSEVRTDDMTTAERFATQNQCTLKKNERFSGSTMVTAPDNGCDRTKETKSIDTKTVAITQNGSQTEKPKAEVKPQENANMKKLSADATNKADECDTPHIASTSQMAKDTAGVTTTSALAATTVAATPAAKEVVPHKSPIPNRNTQKFVSQFADLHLTGGCLSTTSTPLATTVISEPANVQQMLTSFKPQIKVKPQTMRKPLVLPPTTPELTRRNTSE